MSLAADPTAPPVELEPPASRRLSRSESDDLVLRTITAHAESLLRTARRHSMCADDAQDAYQRALEIFMRHAERLDPTRAVGWLHTVVKHEAMAVRRSRSQLVGHVEVDLDTHEARHVASPEDQAIGFDRVARTAEALQRLKPHEVRALWLKALGNSYEEIAEQTGWTYTKVNRCIAEGRRAFLARYAGIESGEECTRWAPAISAIVDGEADAEQLVAVRPHLRNCPACRASLRELRAGSAPLGAVLPIAAVTTVTASSDHAEPTTSFLTRMYDALIGGPHERATASILKVQSAIDITSSGKLAAVAASTAALAGGGAAVVEKTSAKPVVRSHKQSQSRKSNVPVQPAPATALTLEHKPRLVTPSPGVESTRERRSQSPAAEPQATAPAEAEFAPAAQTAPEASPVPASRATQAPSASSPSSSAIEFAP